MDRCTGGACAQKHGRNFDVNKSKQTTGRLPPEFGRKKPGHFAPGFLYCCATISISQSAHLILTTFVARTLFLQQGHIYFMLWLLGLLPVGFPVALPAPVPRGA